MKLISRIATTVFVFSLLTVSIVNSSSAKVSTNWPQWRGPDGQGVSAETGLPVEWSNTTNVKWKTPIAGRGHSSPIVWGLGLEHASPRGKNPKLGVYAKQTGGRTFVPVRPRIRTDSAAHRADHAARKTAPLYHRQRHPRPTPLGDCTAPRRR